MQANNIEMLENDKAVLLPGPRVLQMLGYRYHWAQTHQEMPQTIACFSDTCVSTLTV